MNSLIAEKIKVADFLKMEGEPGFIYELIDGEIVKNRKRLLLITA